MSSDHPNARHQRRQPEEKGSFGKSTRRKGSTRATRTQTPAKKENPTLDGFEAALKFDTQREPEEQPKLPKQATSDSLHQALPTLIKEPMQVMLYGYSPETQWAAISFYETVSGGMICEDYDRNPPAEKRKFYSNLATTSSVPRRALTRAERQLAMQYAGGDCWIRVTFDSREAAERAIFNSPHLLQGHWVYAQPYRGMGPESDEPILVREEDRQQGLLGAPKPKKASASTLGSSFQPSSQLRQSLAPKQHSTLPRGFQATTEMDEENESVTVSSTTATDATVVPEGNNTSLSSTLRNRNPTTFSHFPDMPRTVLRPANEALLPQATWTERLLKRLTESGWYPGDVIGSAVPRLEDGGFDWDRASFYWRVCFWLDGVLGSDLCGMKDA